MVTAKQKRKTSTGTNPKAKFANPKKRPASPSGSPDLRGKDLERAVEQFQTEPDDKRAHEQWKEIESSIFGVQLKN